MLQISWVSTPETREARSFRRNRVTGTRTRANNHNNPEGTGRRRGATGGIHKKLCIWVLLDKDTKAAVCVPVCVCVSHLVGALIAVEWGGGLSVSPDWERERERGASRCQIHKHKPHAAVLHLPERHGSPAPSLTQRKLRYHSNYIFIIKVAVSPPPTSMSPSVQILKLTWQFSLVNIHVSSIFLSEQ